MGCRMIKKTVAVTLEIELQRLFLLNTKTTLYLVICIKIRYLFIVRVRSLINSCKYSG